jgi:hypothetical protein
MDDLHGRDQGPPGQGPPGQGQGPPGQGRGGVFQPSDTNSSSSFNAELLRSLLPSSSTPALGSLNNNSNTNANANANAELLRCLLSSGQPASAVSNPPAGESVESAVRREILRLSMGGSEQNTQSNPLNALILDTISQLQANSGPTSGSINRPNSDPNNGPSSDLNSGPVNDTSRGPNDVPRTTADLSPEELQIVSLMRRENASLQNASSIPERATMPSIEEQLTLLIQQQQAQQARVSSAPDALHPASRDTADVWTGQQYSQQSFLDYLQLPLHLQSDRARPPDGLLQLQLQRQLQNLAGVAGQQPSQQQALENLQYQPQGQSDRATITSSRRSNGTTTISAAHNGAAAVFPPATTK